MSWISWSANFMHEIEVFVNSTQRVELKQLTSALKRWLLLEELMLATRVHPPPNVSNYIKGLGSLWVPQFGVLQGTYQKVWAFLAEFMLETNFSSGGAKTGNSSRYKSGVQTSFEPKFVSCLFVCQLTFRRTNRRIIRRSRLRRLICL